jgi:hypothetical protein
MEHPMVTQINRTGYPENMIAQPLYNAKDFFGDAISTGAAIVVIPNHNSKDIILESNLEDYLIEVLGCQYKLAK